MWTVSVTMPTWLPVKLTASTPRSASAMHTRAMAMRSPAVISMSISRPGRVLGHLVGQGDQLVGLLAHGRHDHDDVVAALAVKATWSATARMRSGSATDVPPNFWTIRATRTGGYKPTLTAPRCVLVNSSANNSDTSSREWTEGGSGALDDVFDDLERHQVGA